MSVYSYVELKVHTNVRKVGTHLNVWYIKRMFAESTRVCLYERSIYIMNIPLSRPFSTFSFSIILYLYTKREHSFPHLTFPATFLPSICLPLYTLLLYTLYIERNILSRNFLPFSRPFLTLYYTLIIYREWYTLSPPPFYPL